MAEKDQEEAPEIVSDQEKEFAQNALADLKKKNYLSCLQNLTKLKSTRINDFKVLHNEVVVEFYKSDLKKTDEFQKSLNAICNQFKIRIDKLDEIDHCIAQFNLAILLFHQRQYTSAQKIMDKVYKFIEPMEEGLAKQVSLLAIELQLCLRQPDKALTLISYLENNLMYGGSIPLKGLDKSGKEKKIQLPPPKPIAEDFQRKLLKYKIRCYLMNHSISIAAKEIPVLLQEKENIDAIFLDANLDYTRGRYKDAMDKLASIPIDSYIYNECGESTKVMFYNNMGAIYQAMGKPNLACHHFQTALKEDLRINQENAKKDKEEKPLYTLGGSKYHELMYNLGISLLHAGRPTEAFECLIIAVRRYHRNSRLWLRIGECCIMAHKEGNEIDFDIQKKQKEIVVDVVGSKDKQKVILRTNFSKDRKYSMESQSYAIPVPTIEFATLCLRNAYTLIPSESCGSPAPLFLIPGVSPPAPPPGPSLSPSSPASGEEIAALRNAVLAAGAYASLCVGDYIVALRQARELLAQPDLSGIHRLLGHLYAAESLILSDKIQEALDHLNPENVKDISFTFETHEDGDEAEVKNVPPSKWFPNTVTSAHSVMQYNIAVAKTIRGQLEQAADLLKQIWQQRSPTCQVPAHIIMLVIYIELQLGNAEMARKLIQQYSFQHRISG